jgi:hypothetical protein
MKFQTALLLKFGFVLMFLCASAFAQHCQPYWTPEYKCAMGCGPCGTSGSGGGRASRPPAPPKPTRAELDAQKADALNETGLAASKAKDWKTAEVNFRQALKLSPNERAYHRNLAITLAHEAMDAKDKYDDDVALKLIQEALALDPPDDDSHARMLSILAELQERLESSKKAAKVQEQRQIQDKLSAADMKDALNRMVHTPSLGTADAAKSDANSGGGLTFSDSVPKATPTTAAHTTQEPGSVNTGEGKGLFGTQSNPSNPQLEFSAAPPAVAVQSAMDQLTSAANSGAAAKAASTNEAVATQANCAFDTKACAKTESIFVNKNAPQTPGEVALASHIKEAAKSDSQIQQSLAYYKQLDSEKMETQANLAETQKKIDSGSGDAAALNAQKVTLTNDLNRYNADQANTEAQIKKRLVEINLPWDEAPTSNAAPKTMP